MSPINLTFEEIKEITGRCKPSAQIRWLQTMGFTVLRRADGKPLISRAHFEFKMGGTADRSKAQTYEPNFGAI